MALTDEQKKTHEEQNIVVIYQDGNFTDDRHFNGDGWQLRVDEKGMVCLINNEEGQRVFYPIDRVICIDVIRSQKNHEEN